MNLYLDTEFNGHGGELISLAIASTGGIHFYGVLKFHAVAEPWVAQNVIPHLVAEPETVLEFRHRLKAYLEAREGSIIYADWPADFEHLMNIMCGKDYESSFMIECSMKLLKSTEPEPAQPHNALSDAIALMVWHNSND